MSAQEVHPPVQCCRWVRERPQDVSRQDDVDAAIGRRSGGVAHLEASVHPVSVSLGLGALHHPRGEIHAAHVMAELGEKDADAPRAATQVQTRAGAAGRTSTNNFVHARRTAGSLRP